MANRVTVAYDAARRAGHYVETQSPFTLGEAGRQAIAQSIVAALNGKPSYEQLEAQRETLRKALTVLLDSPNIKGCPDWRWSTADDVHYRMVRNGREALEAAK